MDNEPGQIPKNLEPTKPADNMVEYTEGIKRVILEIYKLLGTLKGVLKNNKFLGDDGKLDLYKFKKISQKGGPVTEDEISELLGLIGEYIGSIKPRVAIGNGPEDIKIQNLRTILSALEPINRELLNMNFFINALEVEKRNRLLKKVKQCLEKKEILMLSLGSSITTLAKQEAGT